MQRRVLNYLYEQGGLTLFAFPGESTPEEALERFALAQNAGARFVVFDFTCKQDGNTGITLGELFERPLSQEELAKLDESEVGGWIFAGYAKPVDGEDAFRKFYHNLELLKKKVPHQIGILPNDATELTNKYIYKIAKLLVIAGENLEASSVYLEDSPELASIPLFWALPKKPVRKIYPKAHRAVKNSYSRAREFKKIRWDNNPEKFVKALAFLYKAEILRKNPLDGFPKIFSRLAIFFFLIVVILPFTIPTQMGGDISNMRDRIAERNKLSMAPSFTYTFDGKESVQRIARYAIGRFNAVITDEKMIRQYVEETMEENGYNAKAWEKNSVIIPPAETVVKFSRPDNLSRAAADSIGAAWKYWTSIVSDSVAYITEFYHAKPSANQRQHNGIDLASRQGARILAPFAAKAWTSKDERGGVIIGLVREKDVMLFMHCDQLLYLDGQEVMPGDPIATVGVTGHTTGPHAHIVTGIISKNGSKRIGNVKYNVIDPIKWFYSR